ncbi:metallophosphoesterase [Pedobacter sp. SYSU D00535]|uniref:metallophosphoesterase n=1 Tax=Pedobacter sp. SYSU D00535 TaxID=2810308 RepID=UPI001A95EA4E|nr:metallophosphoesterase [Pedobacter sp. SYSU D00535]
MILNKLNQQLKFPLSCLSLLAVVAVYGQTTPPKKVADTAKEKKEFSIAVIPDTQYNTKESQGGSNALFTAQTDWIVKNREKENIVYVIHVGDIVDDGDSKPEQWDNAVKALYRLEKPQPGLPYGIPYGLAVGNHDQSPSQFAVTGNTYYFNKYFGVEHFKNRPWYGGNYKNDNDSHYDLFSAGGSDFIVIYIEYDAFDEDQENMNNWAAGLLDKYSDRKAIVVSHYIIGFNKVPGTNLGGEAQFGKQGKRLYDRLKTKPNLFMMLCGHVGDNGEGYRQDTYAGKTVKTFLADYQSRPRGGNGLMRLMKFSPEKDLISVQTLSPDLGTYERDGDSEFVKPWLRESSASRIYDFNNDGKSEIAFYQAGTWHIGGDKVNFGKEGDIPVPADYLGSGRAELAVYSPAEQVFRIKGLADQPLGEAGDVPLPADYTGDGVADLAVWRPSNATWYIKGQEPRKHGWKESLPVPADYDGDGKAELAVFRYSNHVWYIADLGNVPFGQDGDIPVPGDYNGDGKSEIAVYRPSSGEWLFYNAKTAVKLGKPGDIPVPGDYFGNGRIEPAVYRPASGTVYSASGKQLKAGSTKAAILNLPYPIRSAFFKSE